MARQMLDPPRTATTAVPMESVEDEQEQTIDTQDSFWIGVSGVGLPGAASYVSICSQVIFYFLCPKLLNEIRLNLNLRLNLTEN